MRKLPGWAVGWLMLVLVMGVAMVGVARVVGSGLRRLFEERSVVLARTMADELNWLTMAGDAEGIRRRLEAVREEVLYAGAAWEEGEIWIPERRSVASCPRTEARWMGGVLEVRVPIRWSAPEEVPPEELLAEPPKPAERVVGCLVLGFPTEHVRRAVLSMEGLLLVLFVVLLGALVFVYLGWLRGFVLPMQELARAVRRFARGEMPEPPRAAGDEEMRHLQKEVFSMMQVLRNREEELRRVNEELERANRAKATFLGSVSHELKTPLHTLLGNAQLLREEILGALREEQKEAVERILKDARQLHDLIDRMLEFTKLEVLKPEVFWEPVRLREAVEEVVRGFREAAEEKGLTVKVEVQDGEVVLDAVKFQQILGNLVGNAVKYTAEGTIWVRAFRRGGWLVVEVEDTGPGIPREAWERIFEPFETLQEGPRRSSGLGLAICRRYAELMGGRVYLRPLPHRGSCFVVELPFREMELLEDAGSREAAGQREEAGEEHTRDQRQQ